MLAATETRTTDPVAHQAFVKAKNELRQAIDELRDLAWGIHPAVLSQLWLEAALQDVADKYALPIRLDISVTRVSPSLETTVYFLISEALTNVVKHAQASNAAVTVRTTDSTLEMEIADDGRGGAQPSGQGITNIVDRVHAMDGKVSIESPPGHGTRLSVRIPLTPQTDEPGVCRPGGLATPEVDPAWWPARRWISSVLVGGGVITDQANAQADHGWPGW